MATATNRNSGLNYQRLLELNRKVRHNVATQSEKDELMQLLFENGSISEKKYQDYKSGRNTEDLVKMGLIIGGIILFGYLLGRTTK
jgi:hypothetical protein